MKHIHTYTCMYKTNMYETSKNMVSEGCPNIPNKQDKQYFHRKSDTRVIMEENRNDRTIKQGNRKFQERTQKT